MINTAERSTILLVCLGLDTDKVEIKKVGIAELKGIFDGYGHLKKVIIFTRKVLLKAFLEYDSFESAEAAKNAIHETLVKNYGKARVYFSPMQDLKFSNKYLEFWEEPQNDKTQIFDDDSSTKQSLKLSVLENSHLGSIRKDSSQSFTQSIKPHHRYTLFAPNKTEVSDIDLDRDSFLSTKNLIFNSQPYIFSTKIADSKQLLFTQLELPLEPVKSDSNNEIISSLSKVVLVSNLDYIFRNTEELFNLFSAFGNISKILYMKNLQKALIEYTEVKYADKAINSFNNLVIGETRLRVNHSNYRTIDLNKNNKNENSMQFNDVLLVLPMRNRYRSNYQSFIRPLSSNLVVSFPKINGIQNIDIYLAIEKICKPLKTKLLYNKGLIGKSEVISIVFSFKNIESAVYVMSRCHNSIIKGALLDIFFF